MNYSYTDIQNPEEPQVNVNVSTGENLGTISVFVSAILLSLGGFIAILSQNIRKSRCTTVNCCCYTCTRELQEEESTDRPSDLKV